MNLYYALFAFHNLYIFIYILMYIYKYAYMQMNLTYISSN